MLFLVVSAGLLIRGMLAVLTAQTAYAAAVLGPFGVFALLLMIPDRYIDPSAHLLGGDRLQLFERLLSGARMAHAKIAERLEAALAQWLCNDRFPEAVLPGAQTVWRLASLRGLVHIARQTGETACSRGGAIASSALCAR
jgi:hypothetical protein